MGFTGEELTAIIPRLRRIARSFCKGRLDEEELLQDVLTQMWRKRDRYVDDGRPGALLRWGSTVMHNEWVNATRKYTARNGINCAMPVTEDGELFEELQQMGRDGRQEHHVLLNEVSRAIDDLPDIQRGILLAIVLDSSQDDQVAAKFGIPIGTVRSRTARARAALREQFA